MSVQFVCNVYRSGTLGVIWQDGMLTESNIEPLEQGVAEYLSKDDIPLAPVHFQFDEVAVVINTAFDRLKALCRQCTEKGREVVFINPSPAMSDFLSISDDFKFTVQAQ